MDRKRCSLLEYDTMLDNQMMYDVFISYSSKQKGFVRNELTPRLRNEGIKVWVDTEISDTSHDWRVEIDDAIDQSRILLLVLTPDAHDSAYVTYEWSYAMGKRKRIIVLKRHTIDEIHPRLKTTQYLEFTDAYADWSKLLSIVQSEIEAYDRQSIDYIPKDMMLELLREWLYASEIDIERIFDLAKADLITMKDIAEIKHGG